MTHNPFPLYGTAALFALCSLPRAAHAQENGEPASSAIEVVVSAQKRDENLMDVPVPVTAISSSALLANNQLRLQDYSTRIPGFTVSPTPSAGQSQMLTIRGISMGLGSNPTVGVVVDDVSYGSATNLGGFNVVPDIDPSDLARVEVLRGPQGTLYGASSMGGLLKFVTVDPSTERVSGQIQVGTSSVQNGDDLGHSVRGSVNLPVSDTFAVRASGFTRKDPGYIDNPVLNIDDVNEVTVSGGRLSALWRPSEVYSLKLSALYQTTEGDGASDVVEQPGMGDLQQNYIPGAGSYERTVQAYSATLNAKLGAFDMTAVSGFNINRSNDSVDFTFALSGLTEANFGVSGTPLVTHTKTRKFTQEIRFTRELGARFDWLFGAFYTRETSDPFQTFLAEDEVTGEVLGEGLSIFFPRTYREYAGFTNLTYHVTDRFDVQFGARASEIRQKLSETFVGLYTPVFTTSTTSTFIYPEQKAENSPVTFLVAPELELSDDMMVYARLSSGYRPGDANLDAGAGLPRQYDADKTKNYEIGLKGSFLDRLLTVDASLFYIDWDNIQLSLNNPDNGLGYTGNGGSARSQGVELSIESRPLDHLMVSGWVAWTDAELSSDFPVTATVYGVSGDRLPNSSRFSGNLSLDGTFPLGARMTGVMGASVSYAGEQLGAFMATPERSIFPAYARTDLRAGVEYDDWNLNFFVNNVADKRAKVAGGLGTYPPYAYTYIQPRVAGLAVSKSF